LTYTRFREPVQSQGFDGCSTSLVPERTDHGCMKTPEQERFQSESSIIYVTSVNHDISLTADVLTSIACTTSTKLIERFSIKALAGTRGTKDHSCSSACRLRRPEKHVNCLAGMLRNLMQLRRIMPPSLMKKPPWTDTGSEEAWRMQCPLLFASLPQVGTHLNDVNDQHCSLLDPEKAQARSPT